MDDFVPVTACPQCGAKNEAEAQRMCKPVLDDCPMCVCDKWDDALAYMTKMANWVPSEAELAELNREG